MSGEDTAPTQVTPAQAAANAAVNDNNQPRRRLRRANALSEPEVRRALYAMVDLTADDEDEAPAEQVVRAPSPLLDGSQAPSSMDDFIVPDEDMAQALDEAEKALAEDSQDSSQCPPSGKRAEPEPDQSRMLLDEELIEESQRAPPPARRAEPAPPADDDRPAAAAAPAEANNSEIAADVSSTRATYERWCFTWYPGEELWRPVSLDELTDCVFLVWQEEKCPTTGRLHLQGYMRFNKRKRWNQVLNLLRKYMPEPSSLFLKRAIKPELACVRYCSKDETRWPEGKRAKLGQQLETAGKQGHRSDLAEHAQAVLAGKRVSQLATEAPEQIVMHAKGWMTLESMVMTAKWSAVNRDITVTVLWGPTNKGKSHRVRTAEPSLFVAKPGRGPWDSYEYQPAVLLDEFGMGSQWDINEMKNLMDKWPCELNCRFANKWAAWSRMYIISQDPPHSWYMMAPRPDLEAFWRRVTQVQHITEREDDPHFDPEVHCVTEAKPY